MPKSKRTIPISVPTAAASTPGVTTISSVKSVADPVPDVTMPTVPAGFTPIDLVAFRGYYPTTSVIALAPKAITELGRFVDYTALMGASSPSASAVAALMVLGMNWRTLRDATIAWEAYVKTQDAIAWKSVMSVIDEARPTFTLVLAKNPSIAAEYPALVELMAAHKAIAVKAKSTKKKKAQEAAVTAANAATAANEAATAAAVASAVAATKAEAAAAATPKVVTTP